MSIFDDLPDSPSEEVFTTLFADEQVTLGAGDYLWLAPGRRHRVEETSAQTIWLAVHLLAG